jgi:hypothetical protein
MLRTCSGEACRALCTPQLLLLRYTGEDSNATGNRARSPTMPVVVPISPQQSKRGVAAMSQSIHGLKDVRARFFGLLTFLKSNSPSAERYVAQLSTAIENIALGEDLPDDPEAWFRAFILRIHDQCSPQQKDQFNVSACLGIAWSLPTRTQITLVTSGEILAAVLTCRSGASVIRVTVAEPTRPKSTLQFHHTIDGALGPRDVVVIGTASLKKPLEEAVVSLRCPKNRERILPTVQEHITAQAPSLVGFIVAPETPGFSSHASMQSFLQLADSTDALLTPRLGPMMRRYFSQVRSTLRSSRPGNRSRRRPPKSQQMVTVLLRIVQLCYSTIRIVARAGFAMTIDATHLTARGLHAAAKFVRQLLAQHTKKRSMPIGERLNPKRLLRAIPSRIASTRQSLNRLPPLSRTLLIAAGVFAILFLSSTALLWRRKTVERDILAYNQTVAQIEELRSVAEARLLFSDYTSSREAIQEAMRIAETLPTTSRARRERTTLLAEELEASLDRARQIVRLDQPLQVASSNADPTSRMSNDIALHRDKLLTLSESLSTLVQTLPRTGEATVIELTPTPSLERPVRILPYDDRLVLLIDRRARSVIIDVNTGNVSPMIIESPPPTITDAGVFRSRLYLLQEDGTITRHARTAGGFSAGTTWKQADHSTEPSLALAVASTILVYRNDGTSTSYLAGRPKIDSLLDGVDPPMKSVTSARPLRDGDAWALADSDSGRIAIVRNDGILQGQLQSESFIGLEGIDATADGNAIYVLSQGAISLIVPPGQQ